MIVTSKGKLQWFVLGILLIGIVTSEEGKQEFSNLRREARVVCSRHFFCDTVVTSEEGKQGRKQEF
jgi:hypothetical protein